MNYINQVKNSITSAQQTASDLATQTQATAAQLQNAAAQTQATAAVLEAAGHAGKAQIEQFSGATGGGISGQPTIERGKFAQTLAETYYEQFSSRGVPMHVLVLYDKLNVIAHLYGALDSNFQPSTHPVGANRYTAHHKVSRGYHQAGLWGFNVYIFKGGNLNNLGDGGYINWAWKSPSCVRDGNKVEFKQLQ